MLTRCGHDFAVALGDSPELAVRSVGSDGPPVLFLTSGFGSRVLDPDPSATAAAGARLLTLDRRGYGRSPAYPATAQPTMELIAADLATVIELLALGSVAVIGWSAGAIAAAALAAWHPQLVARLILVAARAPAEAIPLLPAQTASLEPLLAAPDSAYRKLIEALRATQPDVCLEQFTAGPADQALLRVPGVRDRLLAMTTEAMAHGSAGAAADMTAQFVSPWGFDPGTIHAPTTLFYGERDELVTLDHARWWAMTLPCASLITVEGVGHLIPLTSWQSILSAALREPSP